MLRCSSKLQINLQGVGLTFGTMQENKVKEWHEIELVNLKDLETFEVAAGKSKAGLINSGNKKLVFFRNATKYFDLEDLLRASTEVLGNGTFGTAYKAVLEIGNIVCVKRLKDVRIPEQEFREKIEVVGSMDHTNLVPLRASYCRMNCYFSCSYVSAFSFLFFFQKILNPRDNPYFDDNELQPEIWALGFRNPWRCSFDSERPSYFLCADVGQDHYEEVDIITKGGNYGWRVYEGMKDTLLTLPHNLLEEIRLPNHHQFFLSGI
ncbi:hypothetical protein IFM89_017635 [Coptis chinensis]|uniref:Glucose/Sorbosone dehydrogenase domain-containing protein n=1 Tax=Coptis chinensis TaxID=261450 RepID=A0A835LIV4_9MAGN|nr:hypothetical protein IFM89_017635 [Coptis chinensis]